MANSGVISVVIYQDGDWWVAQCLEYDLATQAKKLRDLEYELARTLIGHVVASCEEGLEPFENLPAAPDEFWQMFDEGLRVEYERRPFRIPKYNIPLPIPDPRVSGLATA